MEILPEDKERLIRYIDFMESELADFPKFGKVDWRTYNKDKDARRNLERWVENIVNCSIDIAKVILASEDRRIPTSYKGILEELGVTKHFDETFGEDISLILGTLSLSSNVYGINQQSFLHVPYF